MLNHDESILRSRTIDPAAPFPVVHQAIRIAALSGMCQRFGIPRPYPLLTTVLLVAGLLAGPALSQAPAPSPTPAPSRTLACPDLAGATQVAACPSEDELRYTFVGFCSDNARLYDGKADDCTDFSKYRKSKYIALWESADGEFSAYPSCDLDRDAIRAAKPARVAIQRRGAVTQLVCDYGNGIRFTHRTRASCRVDGDGSCDTPENCRATCK